MVLLRKVLEGRKEPLGTVERAGPVEVGASNLAPSGLVYRDITDCQALFVISLHFLWDD
jgi:hypothetical protein